MNKNKKMKFKAGKEGYCSICGNYSKLTRDHIPPQGCVKATRLELKTLSQYLSNSNEKPVISDNGLNIMSICGNCNNNLLGIEYDSALIHASRQLSKIIRNQNELGLYLPEQISFRIKPQRLLRSVIGHVLASKLPLSERTNISAPFPDALKNYFLDPSSNISEKIEIYYWIYPSNKQVVIDGLSIGSAMGEGFIAGSCLLKFFPLAFWIIWDKPDTFPVNLTRMPKDKFKGLDDTCEIIVDLRNLPSLSYPEKPTEGRYIMFNDDSSFIAQPKKSKGFGIIKS
jgi:hypothetical protein